MYVYVYMYCTSREKDLVPSLSYTAPNGGSSARSKIKPSSTCGNLGFAGKEGELHLNSNTCLFGGVFRGPVPYRRKLPEATIHLHLACFVSAAVFVGTEPSTGPTSS